MDEKEMLLHMYNKYSEQIPALFARRQVENRYYLAICLAIFGSLGWMLDNGFLCKYPWFMFIACLLGEAICFSWCYTLRHYNIRIKSKCNILREMETTGSFYELYVKDKPLYYLKNENATSRLSRIKSHDFWRHKLPIYSFAILFAIALIPSSYYFLCYFIKWVSSL
jgi:hypothetical protein